MNYGDVYLNNLLQQYRQQLKEQKRELKTMPAGNLFLRKQNGRVQYMQEMTADTTKKRTRKGITKNKAMIDRLARKKYLELSNQLLTDEIANLEAFLAKRVEPAAGNVLKLLPKAYRELPEKTFFPEKRRADAWVKEPYQQNTSHVDEKIHVTSKGLRVRSKSELIIAEKLDAFQIPYRYDALVYFQHYSFSPDFTILTMEGLKYWEHCGMMLDPGYKKYNKWKLSMYEKMGIVPWKNLIVTYDTEDGGLNTAIIEGEIRNKLS